MKKNIEIRSLNSKINQIENAKKLVSNAAKKATELFEAESTENRKIKEQLKDSHEAHKQHEVEWFKEKVELEKEIAMLKGEVLVLKDNLNNIANRNIFQRIFKVGENK